MDSKFWDIVGRNTNYLLHPEETVADNFSFLVIGQQVETPRILKQFHDLLTELFSK